MVTLQRTLQTTEPVRVCDLCYLIIQSPYHYYCAFCNRDFCFTCYSEKVKVLRIKGQLKNVCPECQKTPLESLEDFP